jgi:hypothetical protein
VPLSERLKFCWKKVERIAPRAERVPPKITMPVPVHVRAIKFSNATQKPPGQTLASGIFGWCSMMNLKTMPHTKSLCLEDTVWDE